MERRLLLRAAVVNISGIWLGIVAVCSSQVLHPDQIERLQSGLSNLRLEWDRADRSASNLEAAYNALVSDQSTDGEKAVVYSALMQMYGSHTLRKDNEKALSYAQRVTQLNIDDPHLLSLAYIGVGNLKQILNRGVVGDKLAEARREIVVSYLRSIRLLSENQVGSAYREVPQNPGFLNILPSGDEARDMRIQETYQADLRSYEEAVTHNELADNFRMALDQTAFLYSRMPLAPSGELRALATEIIENPAVVEEVMAVTEKAVNERLELEARRTASVQMREIRSDIAVLANAQMGEEGDSDTSVPALPNQEIGAAPKGDMASSTSSSPSPWIVAGVIGIVVLAVALTAWLFNRGSA